MADQGQAYDDGSAGGAGAGAGAGAGTAAQDTAADKPALSLKWVFGFNNNIVGGMHNLTDESRDAVFYCSAHTGIIYDYKYRRQQLLQGHCNPITCSAVSEDKRWVVTADAGADSMIVVWDTLSGTPIKTIFNPHPHGVQAIDISPDALYIVTLSHVPEDDTEEQSLAVWEWTSDRDGPLHLAGVPAADVQTCVKFNPAKAHDMVSNGHQRVIFWNWESSKMRFYSPPLSQRDFRQSVGAFTVSSFLPGSTQAVTATVDGDILLWDESPAADGEPSTDKRAIKIVRVSPKGGIAFLTTLDNLLIAGSEDGAVRFFDYGFRLVSWFEDVAAGAITSISFANEAPREEDPDHFHVPDFLLGTRKSLIIGMQASLFEELSPEERKGTLIVQGIDDEIHGLAAHPFLQQFACCTYSGNLHMWDYTSRQLMLLRTFDVSRLRPQSVAIDPRARFVVVGFTNGALKVMGLDRFSDLQPAFRNSQGAITDIRFSADGSYMATADADRCVCLYRYMRAPVRRSGTDAVAEDEQNTTQKEEEQWVYLGRNRAHSRPITSLEFGSSADSGALLVSIGEDRCMVEYDVGNSSIAAGLLIKGKRTKADQTAVPTCCMWHPRIGASAREDMLITASDEYKFKLWNAANKSCRKTVLAPTYGGPINCMKLLPSLSKPQVGDDASEDATFMVYGTAEKVVGLVQFPLDGNPDTSMGLIAHPGEVAAMVPSHDGRYLLTAGGMDCTVNLWAIDTSSVENLSANSRADGGMAAFLGMLEGGAGGSFHEEIADFFMYAQLRSQGEDSTSPRWCSGRVSLSELPNIMRALGYYPSEQEIENMVNEIKYASFTTTGKTSEDMTLNELIKLYVNHRPVLGVGKAQIADALGLIANATQSLDPEGVEWNLLSKLLKVKAEKMSPQELNTCLSALVGDPRSIDGTMTSDTMAHDVLGFEDYEAMAAAAQ